MKFREKKYGLLAAAVMSAVMILALLMGLMLHTLAADVAAFSDVSKGSAYYDDICWAAEHGVVTGNGGKFKPEQNVTMQQFFTMLSRAIPEDAAEQTALLAPKGSMLYHLRRAIQNEWTLEQGRMAEYRKNEPLAAGYAWNAALMATGTQVYSGVLSGQAANQQADGINAAKALGLAEKGADGAHLITRAEAVHIIRTAKENQDTLQEPAIVKEMKDVIKDVPQTEINGVYEDLMLVPEEIRKAFREDGWKIQFDPDKIGSYSASSGIYNIRGMTSYSEKTIYLADTDSLLHELGHYYQETLKTSGRDENVYEKFEAIRKEEKWSGTLYASGNQKDGAEFFADAFRFYVLHGKVRADLIGADAENGLTSQKYFDQLAENHWIF